MKELTRRLSFAEQTIKNLTSYRLNVLTTYKKQTSPQPSPKLGEGVNVSFARQTVKNFSPFTPHSSLKFGFTLAEVLITLGIIGVVAAMTMPTLIANHKKKVVAARLKQTYSQLSQAIQSAQAEYGDYSGWDEANINGTHVEQLHDTKYVKIFADKYILPYLKTVSTPERAMLKEKGYKKIINKKGGLYVGRTYPYYFAELTNGVTLLFTNNGNGTTNTIGAFLIYIDVDGSSGENRLGHDIFPIHFSPQKGFYVINMYKSENDLIIDCKNANTNSCFALIIKSGWEMKKYPW